MPWLENELTTLAHRQDTNQLSYQARATRGNFEKWDFWVRGHEDAVSGWLFWKWSPESLHQRTLPLAFQSRDTAPACSSASGIPGVLWIPIRATKLCWSQNYSSQSFYQQIRGLFGNSKKLQCRTIKLYKNHRQAPQLKERYVRYLTGTKEEVGRSHFKQKCRGGKCWFRVTLVSLWLSCWGVGFSWEHM